MIKKNLRKNPNPQKIDLNEIKNQIRVNNNFQEEINNSIAKNKHNCIQENFNFNQSKNFNSKNRNSGENLKKKIENINERIFDNKTKISNYAINGNNLIFFKM